MAYDEALADGLRAGLAGREGVSERREARLRHADGSLRDVVVTLVKVDADDPRMAEDLVKYFPKALRRDFREAIERHRLRREIIATALVNRAVNVAGVTGLFRLGDLAEVRRRAAEVVDAAQRGEL